LNGDIALSELPQVPITLEGSSVLHQMFRFDWAEWKKLPATERTTLAKEFSEILGHWEHGSTAASSEGHPNQSAMFSQLGHKGDLTLIHFRDSLEDLNRVELEVAQSGIYLYLQLMNSYLSVVELGLYESSKKIYAQLAERGLEPGTPEWKEGIAEGTARTFASLSSRLFPSIPPAKYLCFYPMDRKRGEKVNWYAEPMADRRAMMHDHMLIGRRYADSVRQIITGSIGLDDWEWGVDLFADDPIVFKKLIYEMRFDKVSAVYASFGQFFLSVRIPAASAPQWFDGILA
jgi:chlorite dismutase